MPAGYLNTDLVLRAERDLSPLTSAFEASDFFTLYALQVENEWTAGFEVFIKKSQPEAAINAFLDVIERLEGEPKEVWANCSVKEFDVGYNGPEKGTRCCTLGNETLGRVVKAGASIKMTIYPWVD